MDLRCASKKFGELTDDGYIEVKCSSKFCGEPGIVVIHRFNALTGEMIETKRFRDPVPVVTEEVQDGSRYNSASVRSTSGSAHALH